MAETIKKLESGYPWKSWTNGKAWRAKFDEDFTCTVAGFRNALYAHAKRNGLKVSCNEKPGCVVEFQFQKGGK